MDGLSEVREKLEEADADLDRIKGSWEAVAKRAMRGISEAIALMKSEQGEPGCHEPWCNSHELELCSGCSVLKGWDRSGVTGEPTTCREGKPHEWLPKPCSCGPNDQRKGDRRQQAAILGTESEGT